MNASSPLTQSQQDRMQRGILRGLAEARKYAGQADYQPKPTEHDWASWAGLAVLSHIVRARGYVWEPTTERKPRGRMPALASLIPTQYRLNDAPGLGRSVAAARREAFDRVFRRPHFWLNRDLYRFAVGGAYLEATGTMPSPRTIRDLAAQLGRKKRVPIPGLGDLTYRKVAETILRHRVGHAERRDVGRGYVLDWWKISSAILSLHGKGFADDSDEPDNLQEVREDGMWDGN